MNLKLLLSLVLLVVISSARGQYLSFDELSKIHTLDSVSLKQYCEEKKYVLKKVTTTKYSVSYSYRSADKKSVSFTRSFPNDPPGHVYVYYYLNNAKAYREIKTSAKAAGFTFDKKYAMPAASPDMQNEMERYVKDDVELEFEISNVGPGRYVVTLHK